MPESMGPMVLAMSNMRPGSSARRAVTESSSARAWIIFLRTIGHLPRNPAMGAAVYR